MTAEVLIVGYGNTLRGDDGVGRVAAQALAEAAAIEGIDVVSCHQLLPELAEPIAAADLAIFIDAKVSLGPGEIAVTQVECEPAPPSGLVHHMDPGTLLQMARKLYGRAPTAFLISVGAGSLALSEVLSPAVATALPEVIATARRLVAEHFSPS